MDAELQMAKKRNGKDIVLVCVAINEAYRMEDYEGYEALIEYGAKRFGTDCNMMEDWATDYRISYGYDYGRYLEDE